MTSIILDPPPQVPNLNLPYSLQDKELNWSPLAQGPFSLTSQLLLHMRKSQHDSSTISLLPVGMFYAGTGQQRGYEVEGSVPSAKTWMRQERLYI